MTIYTLNQIADQLDLFERVGTQRTAREESDTLLTAFSVSIRRHAETIERYADLIDTLDAITLLRCYGAPTESLIITVGRDYQECGRLMVGTVRRLEEHARYLIMMHMMGED
jgi:hypothetical protein